MAGIPTIRQGGELNIALNKREELSVINLRKRVYAKTFVHVKTDAPFDPESSLALGLEPRTIRELL